MSISQNYPNVSPQLLIDLSNTQKLDPRIVFSRASTGTYYDANGVLQTAPSGVARFQFDPVTGESLGLLRENQATNLVLRSEEFDNAYWTQTGVTVTANQVVAPDGTLSMDRVTATSASSVCVQRTTTQNGVAANSFFIKKGTARYIYISVYRYNAGVFGAVFDLDAGVITKSGTGRTEFDFGFDISEIAPGLYRCFCAGYNGASPELRIGISPEANPSINFTSRTGSVSIITTGDVTGLDFYIWGAQLEENSFATSYIPTSASQVTRAADTATLTNTDAYNTDEFTAVTKPFGVSGVASNLVTLNGDAPIERLYVYPRNISQDQINTLVENDGYWSWRIVGADFALPLFTTDGAVEVDWGDGTVETLTTAVHTFTNASPHTVRFKLTSGTTFKPSINNNATHKTKVVALGSAPSNMIVDCFDGFFGCANLKSFDATLIGGTSFFRAWFGCSGLTSFPLINTSSGTSFISAWRNCTSLTSFPLIDTSAGTNFAAAWYNCSSLTSFPLINTSSGTNFFYAWYDCSSLTSFPLIDTSAGTNFDRAWLACSGLTEFPLINTSLGTDFERAWNRCSNLTDFPTNFFDSWVGVPIANCFLETWDGCSALTTTSVENILVSIDTSGVSAPATGTEITIDYDTGTGALTSATNTAITSLKAKNWTIKINGVLE